MRISDWSSDVCSSDLRMPAWLAWRAARRNRVPFVTTFHQRPAAATALKRAYNSVMVKGDRVIAISHHVAGRMIDDYGLDQARLRVIQRGVDLGMFDPERRSEEHTSEPQSVMRHTYDVFCLKNKTTKQRQRRHYKPTHQRRT